MHRRMYMTWMLLALFALGLGQVLGVILTPETEEAAEIEDHAQPLILTGEVLLEEEPVYAPEAGIWTQAAPEGKVSGGQTLFTGPASTADTANRVRLLSGALEAEQMVLPRRRENLHSAIAGLSSGESDMLDVMALVLEETAPEALSRAQQQLSLTASSCQKVTAPAGGIFVAGTEGRQLGRIITDRTWHLCLELPMGAAVGDTITAQLLSGIFQETEFTVETAEMTETGCRVLLACEEDVALVAKIRNLTVKILSE